MGRVEGAESTSEQPERASEEQGASAGLDQLGPAAEEGVTTESHELELVAVAQTTGAAPPEPAVDGAALGAPRAAGLPAPAVFKDVEKVALYLALLAILVVLFLGLWYLVAQSAALYGKGVDIASSAYREGRGAPSAMTRRIFLLVSSHEVVTFKAAALAIASAIVVLGALFVLKGVEAAYHMTGESGFWKGTLQTSSPGLVMITFGCALVGWTISSKSAVADPMDVIPDVPAMQQQDAGANGPDPSKAAAAPIPSATAPWAPAATGPTLQSTATAAHASGQGPVLLHGESVECKNQRRLIRLRTLSGYYREAPEMLATDKDTEKQLCGE